MSKRLLLTHLVVFFAGILIGNVVAYKPQLQTAINPQETPLVSTQTAVLAETTFEKAKVKRVIDGDTIELVDGRKVRYIGIDTPETVDPRKSVGCFGRESSSKNKELVLDKEVELEKDISETDRYARLLRYVYVTTPTGREMVNELLVREGYAQESTFPPDVKYQEKFRAAEQLARGTNVGLWGSCHSPSPTVATPSAQAKPQETVTPVTGNQVQASSQPQVQGDTSGCTIKGNISSGGKIYHLPGCGSYDKTAIDESSGERWFCSESEAEAAGWRKAKNC